MSCCTEISNDIYKSDCDYIAPIVKAVKIISFDPITKSGWLIPIHQDDTEGKQTFFNIMDDNKTIQFSY